MRKIKFEKEIAAEDGTFCFECEQFYDILLLVPFGGNKRRFTRHYRCNCCDKVFARHDFGFLFSQVMKRLGKVAIIPWTITAPRPSRRHRLALAAEGAQQEAAIVNEEPKESESKSVSNWVRKTSFRSRVRNKPMLTWQDTMPTIGRAQVTMSANLS